MNSTGILFFISFAIFISVTVAQLNDTDIKELQKEIRDYIKPDEERKSNETLHTRIEKYILAVKEARHRDVRANPVVTGLAEYSRKHRYYEDFMKNANCSDKVKMNECKNRKLDKKINETMNGYHYPSNKTTPNFVKLVADPENHIKYTVSSCNKAKVLRNCIADNVLYDCDNNTRTFILDIQDFLYDSCINATRRDEPQELAQKTNYVVVYIGGAVLFLVVAGSIIAYFICRNQGSHTVA